MDISSSKLRAFLAVLETGNVSRAADELGLSQAAVSAALKRLEGDLSLNLFRRGRFGATPTEAARTLEPHARQLLQQEEALLQVASSLRGSLSGTVRVASFQTLSRLVVPRLIQRLAACYPGVSVALDEHHPNAHAIHQALLEGSCDVGFINHDVDERLRSWLLFEDPLVVLVPSSAEVTTWAEVLALPLISYQHHEDGCSLGTDLLCETFGKHPAYRVKETSTVLGMVAQGMGFAVLPELSAGTLPEGVNVPALELNVARRTYAAVGPESVRLPAVRAVLHMLRELLPESDLPPLSVPSNAS